VFGAMAYNHVGRSLSASFSISQLLRVALCTKERNCTVVRAIDSTWLPCATRTDHDLAIDFVLESNVGIDSN
jgi:hypothetical protein